jgi:hypothetical protein
MPLTSTASCDSRVTAVQDEFSSQLGALNLNVPRPAQDGMQLGIQLIGYYRERSLAHTDCVTWGKLIPA